MNLRRTNNRYCALAWVMLTACGGFAGLSAAHAADTAASIQAQYQQDVQRCNAGQTSQSKATCLQEAGAARDEAQRNQLDNNQSANYGANATDRCTKLPQPQRENCLLQMRSPTKTQGSVEGGGVLRETVIQVPPGTPGSTTVPGTATTPGAGAGTPSPTMPGSSSAPGTTATPLPVQ